MRLAAVVIVGCSSSIAQPELTIVGESTRVRLESAQPTTTAWFDGQRASLVAARGETIGLQVIARTAQPTTLTLAVTGVSVGRCTTKLSTSKPASTAMYGSTQGRGTYAQTPTVSGGSTTVHPAWWNARKHLERLGSRPARATRDR